MSENEYLTRKSRIDPKLRAAGWDVVPYREGRSLSAYDRCAVEEYPTGSGPADYALCLNGAIFGIIEAREVTLERIRSEKKAGKRGVQSTLV
ncbi:hypothetical protein [Methanoculleus sp.]|uniref:hypothetical protein n=1 Tax=Methanoculleus sp. TaxID=90427 RepID=UPI002FC9D676